MTEKQSRRRILPTHEGVPDLGIPFSCNRVRVVGDVLIVTTPHDEDLLLDLSVAERVLPYPVNSHQASPGRRYGTICVDGARFWLHRYLTNAPKGLHVDHWDHNWRNNRLGNLRLATPKQNAENRSGPMPNSATGIRGVAVHRFPDGGFLYRAVWKDLDGSQREKCFEGTDEGLLLAEQYVIARRAEVYTHSDGR